MTCSTVIRKSSLRSRVELIARAISSRISRFVAWLRVAETSRVFLMAMATRPA